MMSRESDGLLWNPPFASICCVNSGPYGKVLQMPVTASCTVSTVGALSCEAFLGARLHAGLLMYLHVAKCT